MFLHLKLLRNAKKKILPFITELHSPILDFILPPASALKAKGLNFPHTLKNTRVAQKRAKAKREPLMATNCPHISPFFTQQIRAQCLKIAEKSHLTMRTKLKGSERF